MPIIDCNRINRNSNEQVKSDKLLGIGISEIYLDNIFCKLEISTLFSRHQNGGY